MEKAKKILMIISLSALAVACIMLILAVFKVPVFQGVPLRFLLIFSTIAVACGMSITELSVIKRKKVLGYVAIALLGLSTLLAMIIFCSNLLTQYSVFNIITSIVALSSVLFAVIISLYSKLGKTMIGLQVPTYVCLSVLDVMLSLLIAGVQLFEVAGMLQVFIVLIIVSVGLLIASAVISAKRKDAGQSNNFAVEIVKLSKAEYDSLLKENQTLKAEKQELRQKLENLESK